MHTFLKIVGALALLAGGVFAIFIVLVLWRMRKVLRHAGKAVPTPSTISLQEDPAAEWTQESGPAAALAELTALGYARGPAYTIPEMPGVSVVALHHPATGAYGAYCHHPAAGEWADFCATLADGTELTVGNPPQGAEMDTRPGTRKVLRPRIPLGELHALLLQELAGQTLRPHRPEDFCTAFQDAYAKDMAWRNAKGGTSAEEFQRIAEQHEEPLSDEQLRQAFQETKRQEITRWHDEALAAFAEKTTLPVAEWKRHEDRMFIFRDNLHPRAFLEYLNTLLELEESEVARYGEALDAGLSLPGLLTRIAADTGVAFPRLGEVTAPVPVQIHAVVPAPEEPAPPAT